VSAAADVDCHAPANEPYRITDLSAFEPDARMTIYIDGAALASVTPTGALCDGATMVKV
jgi:hypothetical protein